MKKPDTNPGKSPSQLISERIAELDDWRGETLAHIRQLVPVFAALGKVMAGKRLAPETLNTVPSNCGDILAQHQVTISHVSGKEAGHRMGHYVVTIVGPRIDGRWHFRSGELEKLSRSAAAQRIEFPEWIEKMKKPDTNPGKSSSQLISERIAELGDWRGETLAHIRQLIKEADPGITEEWKWRGVPVWSDGGIVCTGESYKTQVKLTFLKGAAIDDPEGIFNSSLEGNARRAIDLHQGDEINESAFKELIRAAVRLNAKGKK